VFWKFIAVIVATTALSAQGERLGSQFDENGGNDQSAASALRPKTPMEQIVEILKLDAKAQVPAVQEIFTAAQKDAIPVINQMMQSRQRLVNADLGADAAQQQAELETYSAAATKMATIEANTFNKVYALLKPNQQSKAPQAFAIMAGIFMPTGPAPVSRGAQVAPQGGGR
jgi:hypothetical protein